MKFILFSKSLWSEPPRMRHQVARLLQSYGHDVIFFEKPLFPFQRTRRSNFEVADSAVVLRQSSQLLHHQLRIFWPLAVVNSIFEKLSIIKKIALADNDSPVIVNFNYDYFFLRDIFPKNKIITIINDDFVAQAKFRAGKHVKYSLQKTCEISDSVLTVSAPILDQLAHWSEPKLFLPWADSSYKAPNGSETRDAVLLWAHLDARIDYALLKNVALASPQVYFYLVGPQANASVQDILDLKISCPNVLVLPATNLDVLPMERFFAAIIPYMSNVGDIEAVTLSNKSFQLMCRGLPLIVHGMPHFLTHEAISKCVDAREFFDAIDFRRCTFDSIQGAIADLVNSNQPSSRYAMLVDTLDEVNGANL